MARPKGARNKKTILREAEQNGSLPMVTARYWSIAST